MLTTDATHPNWVPDAEPPSAYYASNDTQINCDGVTIFDSPTFENYDGVIELFTALDYVIEKGVVTRTVTWKIQKAPGKPLQYTQVSFGGPPNAVQLKYFRDLLHDYDLPSPF